MQTWLITTWIDCICALAGNLVPPYRHKRLGMKSVFTAHYIERLGETRTRERRFLWNVWMYLRDDELPVSI